VQIITRWADAIWKICEFMGREFVNRERINSSHYLKEITFGHYNFFDIILYHILTMKSIQLIGKACGKFDWVAICHSFPKKLFLFHCSMYA